MDIIKLEDLTFKRYIEEKDIIKSVKTIAERINIDFKDKRPLFVVVLNGAFMFASDLLKEITIACEISFIKLSSYEGTQSTEKIHQLIGLNEEVKNRHIIIIEDVVDTGHTIEHLYKFFLNNDVASVDVVTFLFKEESYKKPIEIKYYGFNIPNNFVVGYGLDYKGLGRNLKDLYSLIK